MLTNHSLLHKIYLFKLLLLSMLMCIMKEDFKERKEIPLCIEVPFKHILPYYQTAW